MNTILVLAAILGAYGQGKDIMKTTKKPQSLNYISHVSTEDTLFIKNISSS